MEHSTQFYQLNEVINKYKLHLSDVIDFWIGHKIPLYIKMEGVSCKLSCIIRDDNDLFLKDEKRSIYRYRDFYLVKIHWIVLISKILLLKIASLM